MATLGFAAGTIEGASAAIGAAHETEGHDNPTADPTVRAVRRGIRRRSCTPPAWSKSSSATRWTEPWTTWRTREPGHRGSTTRLDQRGRSDISKARDRATRFGIQTEVHGKVVAELTLGFWRYLAATRYLTTLSTPALYAAFPAGPSDRRQQQRQVDRHLKDLLLVRNRAAHHEPIHRRDLARDLAAAVEVTSWVDPTAGDWVADLSTLSETISRKPTVP